MFIQGNIGGDAAGSGPASVALLFPQANTAGNTLVAILMYKVSAGTVSVSDSQGNSWTMQAQNVQTVATSEAWTAPDCASSGANTVTATVSGGNFVAFEVSVVISEYANVMIASVDSSGVNSSGNVANTPTTVTAATSMAGTFDQIIGWGAGTANISVVSGVPLTGAWNPRFSTDANPTGTYTLTTWDIPVTSSGTHSITIVFGPSHLSGQRMFSGLLGIKLLGPQSPPTPGDAWLIVNEPSLGYTDRSQYISFDGSEQIWTLQLRQRGQARITYRVHAGDSYLPTIGTEIWLYDQPVSGAICVFTGTIDDWKIMPWQGDRGDKLILVTVSAIEQCFDVINVPPRVYINLTADQIVTDLLVNVCGGVPLFGQIIQTGVLITTLVCNYDRVSDIFDQLSVASGFVWGVNPVDQSFYFAAPTDIPALFNLSTSLALWAENTGDSAYTYEQNRQDYRNRQTVRINFGAFGASAELFPSNSGTVTLMGYPQQIVQAFATASTQNHAVGAFVGQPSVGDTVTIGLAPTPWSPSTVYGIGNAVLDSNGHQQNAVQGGTSGSSAPTWNDTGGQTVDGTVIWQDYGATNISYTFVSTLDNTQWGQVLIGATLAQTVINLAAAINGNIIAPASAPAVGNQPYIGTQQAGVVYSLPTWEHPVVNVTLPAGSADFTVHAKAAGSTFTSTLSFTSAASQFKWQKSHSDTTSVSATFGGTTGSTVSLSIGQSGPDETSNIQSGQSGNPVLDFDLSGISTSTYPWVQIQYQRVGGDCIVCERTDLVAARAAIEGGTGKYQRTTDDSSQMSAAAGLQECQSGLAAYDVIPTAFEYETFTPGLIPGVIQSVGLLDIPAGVAALAGTVGSPLDWVVEEIQGKLIPIGPGFTLPNGGHYRATVKLININQIGSYMDFWRDLGSGGGGSSQLVAGGGFNSTPTPGMNLWEGIHTMTPISGILTPDLTGNVITAQATLSASAHIAPPVSGVATQAFFVQLFQDGTGGRAVTWDSFYRGLSAFTADTTALTQCCLLFQIDPTGTFAQLLDIPINGAPIA